MDAWPFPTDGHANPLPPAGDLISIRQAAARGITRVRKQIWVNPEDHLEIAIVDGAPGPWLKLWSPLNEGVGVGRDPVSILGVTGGVNFDEQVYLPYTGPEPNSEEYRALAKKFTEGARRAGITNPPAPRRRAHG